MNQLNQDQLSRIVIKGFKSIKECDLELGNINVFIGSNGAGKSNFISIFEMLQRVLERELSYYVGKKGGVTPLLYNGKEATDSILAEFHFGSYLYGFDLEWTDRDSLLFREERIEKNRIVVWGDGDYNESNLHEALRNTKIKKEDIQALINTPWRIYQFHDTSASSRMKSEHNISNFETFMRDASNLAAFLYHLCEYYPIEYNEILKIIQRIAPYFSDFVLKPRELNNEQIVLRWSHKDCDEDFIPSQLSDGTLRFICLATLLLQPTELQPATIIIDEPELGLHPYAITIFTELVKKVAVKKQVILATQSVELLDKFDAENVIVVDRDENGSKFKRLDTKELSAWLEDDYSLGELWNKNILGGRVSR